MKKTLHTIYFSLISILFATTAFGQPTPWQGLATTNVSGAIQGNIEILGVPAETGDYIAAFTPNGDLAGVTIIGYDPGNAMAFFFMSIYGNEGSTTTLMNSGEDFTLKVWDESTNTYYSIGSPASQVGPWNSVNGGGLMTGLELDDVPVTNGFFTFSLNADNVLPIELSAFDVQKRSCDLFTIEWTTKTEINNEYFSIQRSIDDIYSFETIEKIDGAGNATSERVYSYEDRVTLNGGHSIYYRLKQTDFDGESSYSNIIATKFDCGGNTKLIAYPNPFSNEINILLENQEGSQIEVLDAQGKLIYGNQVTSSKHTQISTDDWPEGVYIARSIVNGQIVDIQKIIKQY